MSESNNESLLEHLLCPISLEIMKEPVIAEDGITYEKAGIELWFKSNNTSPMNGMLLQSKTLKPNFTLKTIIEFYVKSKNKDLDKEKNKENVNNFNNVKNSNINNSDFSLAINSNIIGSNNQLNFFLSGSKNSENLELGNKEKIPASILHSSSNIYNKDKNDKNNLPNSFSNFNYENSNLFNKSSSNNINSITLNNNLFNNNFNDKKILIILFLATTKIKFSRLSFSTKTSTLTKS